MSGSNIMLTLTGKEVNVLSTFAKATGAAKRYEAELADISKTGVNAGNLVAKAMINGAKGAEKGTEFLLRQLKKIKGEGRSLATSVEAYMDKVGHAGRASVDEIAEAWEKIDPKIAKVLNNARDKMREADKAMQFNQAKESLGELGGMYGVMKTKIDEALVKPTEDAAQWASAYVAEMARLNPENAERIQEALQEAENSVRNSHYERIASSLSGGGEEAEALSKLIRDDVKNAALEAEGGMDGIRESIKQWKPHLAEAIDLLANPRFTLDDKIRDASKELKGLGGEFESWGGILDKTLQMPLAEATRKAHEIVDTIEKIDPARAAKLREEIDRMSASAATADLGKLLSDASGVNELAKGIAELVGNDVKNAALDAAGGMDAIVESAKELYPHLKDSIDLLRNPVVTIDDKIRDAVKELKGLGGEFASWGGILDKTLEMPLAESAKKAHEIIDTIEKIDPDRARKLREEIDKAAESAKHADFNALLGTATGVSDVVGKIAELIGNDVKNAAIEAEGGMDAIVEKAKQLYPHLKDSIELLRNPPVDLAAELSGSVKKIQELGGAFAMVGGIVDKSLKKPLSESFVEADAIVDELDKINPAGAERLRAALEQTRVSVAKTDFDDVVKKIDAAGGSASILSEMFNSQFRQAIVESEGGIDRLIAKMEKMNPAMKSITKQWRKDWNDAADKAHESFGPMLTTLRESGEVGERAADKIVTEYQRAGKLSRAALEKIFLPLDQKDPGVKKVMDDMLKTIDASSTKATSMFDKLGASALMSIGTIATSYLGIQEAVQAVTTTINDQIALLESFRRAQIDVAGAQAESLQNMTTMSKEDQKFLMGDFVDQVSKNEGIGNRAAITLAVGDARSSGAQTSEEIQENVTTAAKVSIHNQDNIPAATAALTRIRQATGADSADETMSQLIVNKEQSAVADNAKFLKNVSPVVISATEQAGEGMREKAATEAMAQLAAFSKMAGDEQGDSSSNAMVQLNTAVADFFRKSGESFDKASAELADLKSQPLSALNPTQEHNRKELQRKKGIKAETDAGIVSTEAEIAAIQGKLDRGDLTGEDKRQAGIKKTQLNKRLAKLRSDEFTSADQASLDTVNEKESRAKEARAKREQELADTIKQNSIDGVSIAKLDGGTPMARTAFIRKHGLGRHFQDLIGTFGEQKYRVAGQQVVGIGGSKTSDLASQYVRELSATQGSSKRFDEFVANIRGPEAITPELRLSSVNKRSDAATSTLTHGSTAEGKLAEVRDILATMMEGSRRGMGVSDRFDELTSPAAFIRHGTLDGGNPMRELITGLQHGQDRYMDVAGDANSMTQTDRKIAEMMEGKMAAATELLQDPDLPKQFTKDQIGDSAWFAGNVSKATQRRAESDGVITPAEQKMIDVWDKIADVLKMQLDAANRAAAASEDTAINTDPHRNQPHPNNAMHGAMNNR